MPTRFTIVFNSCKQGWTETWYNAQPFEINASKLLGTRLCERRQELLGRGAFIEGFRISPVTATGGPTGIGVVVPGPMPSGFRPPRGNNFANLEGLEEVAWLCAAQTQSGRKRQVWLRGVLDDWVIRLTSNNCAFDIPADFAAAFGRFKEFLLTGGFNAWQLQVLNNDVGVSPIRQIANITLDATNTFYQITTTEAHGFTAGQRVRIRGAKGENVSRALGYRTIRTVVGPLEFIINQTALTSPDVKYFGKGTVRLLSYDYQPFSNFEIMRVSNRKTGRALFVRRGRRRVQR